MIKQVFAAAPKGRCRKRRYRGVAANDQWLHSRIAALNLRRLINLGLTNPEPD